MYGDEIKKHHKDRRSICYNHGEVHCYKCEECQKFKYDDEKHAFTENCVCCNKQLCGKCMDKYEHRMGRYEYRKRRYQDRMRRYEQEYRMEKKIELNSGFVFNGEDKSYLKRKNMYKQKKMNKERKKRKLNPRYWKRRNDKRENKKSITKWNKQYLLSINGY